MEAPLKHREVRIYKTFKEILNNLENNYEGRDVFRDTDGNGNIHATSAAEFRGMVSSLGAAFDTLGLLDGKVAVLGETSVPWIATYFAQVCGGGVIVPLNRELDAEGLLSVIQESGVEGLVFSRTYADLIREVGPKCADVRYFIPIDGDFDHPKVINFENLLKAGVDGAEAYLKRDTHPRELAALVYTSGTSGPPKGVMLSQENMTQSASNALMLVNVGTTCLSVLPVQHPYEFTQGIVSMLCNGTTICINDRLDHLQDNLKLFAPDTIVLVPYFVHRIYDLLRGWAAETGQTQTFRALAEMVGPIPSAEQAEKLKAGVRQQLGGRLSLIICGGAPLPAWYQKAFDAMGFNFVEGYGLTECAPVVSVNPSSSKEYGSIGLPIPCCEVQLANMSVNGEGEICVKGPNVMLGYYQDPEGTAAAMTDGWFHTGDLGWMNDRGFLFLTGRKTDLIVFEDGASVHPEEIEEALLALPKVQEVLVYADKNAQGMTMLAAEIYPGTPVLGEVEEVLRTQIGEQIAEFNAKRPEHKRISQFHLRKTPFERGAKRDISRRRKSSG